MAFYCIEFTPEGQDDFLESLGVTETEFLGLRLRGLRLRHGLSQEKLAKLTHISVRRLIDMEKGRRPIDEESASALSDVLGYAPALFIHLVGLTDIDQEYSLLEI